MCHPDKKNNEDLRLSVKNRYAAISTGTAEDGFSQRETSDDRYKGKRKNDRQKKNSQSGFIISGCNRKLVPMVSISFRIQENFSRVLSCDLR